MLYQPRPRPWFRPAVLLIRRTAAGLAGALGGMLRSGDDTAQLDWMRQSELAELGIRRTDAGDYRSFK